MTAGRSFWERCGSGSPWRRVRRRDPVYRYGSGRGDTSGAMARRQPRWRIILKSKRRDRRGPFCHPGGPQTFAAHESRASPMPKKRPLRPRHPPAPDLFRGRRHNPGRSATARHAGPPMMTAPVSARSCKPCAIVPLARLMSPPRWAVSSGSLVVSPSPRSTARRCEPFLRRQGSASPPSLALAAALVVPALSFPARAHVHPRAGHACRR